MAVCSEGGAGVGYIGRSVNPEPSDQTDLKEQRRCNLEGIGGTNIEAKTDMWGQDQLGRPLGPTC